MIIVDVKRGYLCTQQNLHNICLLLHFTTLRYFGDELLEFVKEPTPEQDIRDSWNWASVAHLPFHRRTAIHNLLSRHNAYFWCLDSLCSTEIGFDGDRIDALQYAYDHVKSEMEDEAWERLQVRPEKP